MAPLCVFTGTGTGIGKTTIACALLRAWSRRGIRAIGLKPIETGGTADVDALAAASARPPPSSPYLLVDPVSPHLAARRQGRAIDPTVVAAWILSARRTADVDVVLVELAGGLFSPITDALVNADLVGSVAPTRVVLVAPNRLGVLHDVLATRRAATATGCEIDAIVLSAPPESDASTATNAEELRTILRATVIEVPRTNDLDVHIEPLIAWFPR